MEQQRRSKQEKGIPLDLDLKTERFKNGMRRRANTTKEDIAYIFDTPSNPRRPSQAEHNK
jgi:hypothetical protein